MSNISENLCQSTVRTSRSTFLDIFPLTLALKSEISSSVKVSALAMMGMRLTLSWSWRMNSISIGFKLRTHQHCRHEAEIDRTYEWPVG